MHPSEDSHPLCACGVEVVVVGDGGDPKAGVVLRRGVGSIAVPRALGETGLSVVCEFGCFFILTLDTAHSLLSAGEERRGKRTRKQTKGKESGGETRK